MTKHALYVSGGVIAGVFVGAGAYVLVSHFQNFAANSFAAATSTAAVQETKVSSSTSAAAGMKRFYDQSHHFTLQYPDDLQVSEFPGADSSLVVAFKDPQTGEGFQVFAAPYDEPKITQQTFEMDEPSGIMQDPQNITVDGASATAFYSQDQAMGNTFEVWFLNGGILYEVTTYKSLDSWLIQILGTWQFVQ